MAQDASPVRPRPGGRARPGTRLRARWWLPPFALVLALVVASVGLVWWVRVPSRLPHADVVLVLGGDGDRLERGLELVRDGVAPVLLISSGVLRSGCNHPADPRYAHNGRLPVVPGVTIMCLDPDPFTTRGEARGFAAMAAAHGWQSVDVVSTRDQANRAWLRLRRCWSGTAGWSLVAPGHDVVYASLYQLAGWAKALVTERAC